VFQVAQRGESLLHDSVVTMSDEIGYKRDTAGIMFIVRVIQT
jgi:hypothetical protein